MDIQDVWLYNEQHMFQQGSLQYEDGRISHISFQGEPVPAAELMQRDNVQFLIPGLVDIHFHGCMGEDLCDAKPESIPALAQYEAAQGVTTICPATMTMSVPELREIMANIGSYEPQSELAAHLAGVNMEGPFISPGNKGAQAADNIIPCSVELFRELNALAKGRIRLVDIAPEEPGAIEFIEQVKDEVAISLAHTMSDYDTAMAAFGAGADHITHTCNAMPPLHHRKPGVIGAASDAGAYAELICDGVHIHPAMVRALFKMLGSERICLISDSMRAAGLQDGSYTLGGQPVEVKGNLAILADGTIAGSVTNLMACMKKAVLDMQIPLEDAVRCAAENPARSIGIFSSCGSLAVGKQADMVLLNSSLELQRIWVSGKEII